ncbi:MAG: DEAD/DEAH box helicase family protein [Candidatus Sericytochromatia bacterium]
MNFSEADTRAKLIDPKLKESLWDENFIIREYYFTDGRKLLGNQRTKRLFADYLLRYKNINLAIIEAKKLGKQPTEGLQQAINYAEKLKVKFIYATNGEKIYEHSLITGKGDFKDKFPTPEELYNRCIENQTNLKENLLKEPFYLSGNFKPRYYQEIAVQSVMEAISEGKNRILLTLATGTGKTFIAFQIVNKVLKNNWNLENSPRKPKILFLADRNILADQAINTFNPFERDLVKINGEEIKRRNGKVPTNAYIFFAIYQAISEKENIGGYYKEYPKDFFDLIIIDECHRGSANEEGLWRKILEHFDSAVHLGLTATPKRQDNVDTYNYFGKPIYEYSLKEGINDGFLTPYKVKRFTTSMDEYVYKSGDKVIKGELEKEVYGIPDFDKNIIIPERTELIAKTILENINTFDKTIVFCVDQEHALLMRDMINKHKTINDSNYCVRVTSDEKEIGRQLLERFQDNDKDIPVILTSSQMLTTGVDARNVRNIVLARSIKSMVEFKQIVGRGTRVFEGKDFFTILDFTGATKLFYDKDWDGLPDSEEEKTVGDKEEKYIHDVPKNKVSTTQEPYETKPGKIKVEVKLGKGRTIEITNIETSYLDEDGKPLTAKQFLQKIIGFIPELFHTEQELREIWSKPETRENLLKDLAEIGLYKEHLETLKEIFQAKDSDIFDVMAHIAFSKNIYTRKQRVETVRNDNQFFEVYSNLKARDFLIFILERYEKDGIEELKSDSLRNLIQLKNMGTPKDVGNLFGGVDKLKEAYYKLQEKIYKAL